MIQTGKLVIDASVAIKWYVPEIGEDQADYVLRSGGSLLAPDLILPEFGNVLWKKVRRGELRQSEAEEIVDAFTSSSPVDFRPARYFLRPAFDIASLCGCTVHDALYLALAFAEDCSFLTADERLLNAAREARLSVGVLLLSEMRG